ncbi:MAG: transposase [Planctomycetota bacterium]
MARLARVVIPGIPHHITQRGTRRQKVFFSEDDYRHYLIGLGEAADRFGVIVWAWCLMPNHMHGVVVPKTENSLALCFGRVHTQYTRRVNFRKGWRGFLWQGRFASSPLDEAHAWHAVRYVERNPVRAKLVKKAEEYPWSSAGFHAGLRKEDPLVKSMEWTAGMADDWRRHLRMTDDEGAMRRLREETMSGRPAGDSTFVGRMEKALGRVLTRGQPGRPRKKK